MIKNFFIQIRLHHWLKNTLIFLPAIASHKIFELNIFLNSLIAFICFGFVASGIYLLNDLIDCKEDQLHPIKKLRPYASNKLSKNLIIFSLIIFFFIGYLFAFLFNFTFFILLVFYFFLNIIYFFILKKIIIIDAFILMFFYLIRVVSGHLINHIDYSIWLISFVFFIFLSLSFLKKYIDLKLTKGENNIVNYSMKDLFFLQSIGIITAIASSLVILLYCNSESTKLLYNNNIYLTFISPLILYWILNTWHKGIRDKIKIDPVTFVAKNIYTYIVLISISSLIILAKI